jgi:hypothetical protein
MTYQTIEIKNLERSPLNVRKTDSKAALEEMKTSILSHGLMRNWTPSWAYPWRNK